ncbi:DivIVA domain-containing protein [Mastigocladopsis repens]|uniref:DivIVA domain-containing protein n=1 Tax=Mastigocladopsis repens TaxID=221287 RepID=UPI0018DBFD2A|nr:DivIVA domain-containing protein [Mastigocladopsis repens]
MLRPKPSSIESNQNGSNPRTQEFAGGISYNGEATRIASLDIQQELNRLEEMILAGFNIPLTRRTLVDEDKLLDQLDYIRLSLPEAFQEVVAIIQQREEILLQAEEYGQQIVDAAQAKRSQILDESDIIAEAEQEASEVRRQVQQECEAMLQETLAEIDRKRRACQQEIEEIRRQAIAEAEAIEQGADDYADGVLENIEQNLQDMLRVIRNGRQQLQLDSSQEDNSQFPKKK